MQIHYGEGEWHSRLLLRPSSEEEIEAVLGERYPCRSAWWVLTPHGEVFPEGIEDNDEIMFRF